MILAVSISLVIGMILGSFLAIRGMGLRMRNPDVCRAMLKTAYRSTHPHWLAEFEKGDGRVCPCCGWSETEGLAR